MPEYFKSSANRVADKKESEGLSKKIYNEFSDVVTVIGCFEETFTLQVKEGSQPYQAPKKGNICLAGIPNDGTRDATKIASDSPTSH